VPAAAPAKPNNFVQVPILEVLDETHDIRTFRMARPEGFEFQAGQFLTVRVRSDGQEHVRCYSISSAPEARGHMEISVKRLGSVSGTLHAMVRPGSFLSVRAPGGAFIYPAGDDRPIVLIAGGVGITPLMAMIRHAVHTEPTRPVTLLYSVRTESDIAFLDELRVLDRRHSQFRAVIAISDVEVTSQGLFPGRITAEFILGAVPDVSHARCFICGPPPMLDVVTDLLQSVGVPRGQIHFEIFNPAIAASAGAPARERPAPAPEAAAAADFEVRFVNSGVSTRVGAGQTLLEAAEGCNANIPSLCRVGVCGTCRTRVASGDAECASQMLGDQDRADGFILPCVTHIHSDCVVEG
jgi:ferredoxin-NADP reductase